MTMQEAAANGARFLDGQEPGWAGRIDRNKLDMSKCDTCMLAQLNEGSYCRGVNQYGIESSVMELGFFVPIREAVSGSDYNSAIDELDRRYEELRRAWLAEIDYRLGVRAGEGENAYELVTS